MIIGSPTPRSTDTARDYARPIYLAAGIHGFPIFSIQEPPVFLTSILYSKWVISSLCNVALWCLGKYPFIRYFPAHYWMARHTVAANSHQGIILIMTVQYF